MTGMFFRVRIAPELLPDADAVLSRRHDIEQDQVRLLFPDRRATAPAHQDSPFAVSPVLSSVYTTRSLMLTSSLHVVNHFIPSFSSVLTSAAWISVRRLSAVPSSASSVILTQLSHTVHVVENIAKGPGQHLIALLLMECYFRVRLLNLRMLFLSLFFAFRIA